jgi:hypothetical protein
VLTIIIPLGRLPSGENKQRAAGKLGMNECSIKELKLSQYPSEFLPTTAGMKVVGTTSYKTWAAAKAAMKADTICT